MSGNLPKELDEVLARVRRYGEEHPGFIWAITMLLIPLRVMGGLSAGRRDRQVHLLSHPLGRRIRRTVAWSFSGLVLSEAVLVLVIEHPPSASPSDERPATSDEFDYAYEHEHDS